MLPASWWASVHWVSGWSTDAESFGAPKLRSIERVLAVSATSVNIFVAFWGGVLSFLSPCVLPVLPVYVSVITGMSGAERAGSARARVARVAATTGMFLFGFAAVFVPLQITVSALGHRIFERQETLTLVAGWIVLLLALVLAATQFATVKFLSSDRRVHIDPSKWGPYAAPVAGAAFGLGWSPCIGPILGAVLTVGATSGSSSRAAGLLIAYTLGMGVPLFAVGVAFNSSQKMLSVLRRHSRTITLVSAGLMAAFGLVLITDNLSTVTSWLTDRMRDVGLDQLVTVG